MFRKRRRREGLSSGEAVGVCDGSQGRAVTEEEEEGEIVVRKRGWQTGDEVDADARKICQQENKKKKKKKKKKRKREEHIEQDEVEIRLGANPDVLGGSLGAEEVKAGQERSGRYSKEELEALRKETARVEMKQGSELGQEIIDNEEEDDDDDDLVLDEERRKEAVRKARLRLEEKNMEVQDDAGEDQDWEMHVLKRAGAIGTREVAKEESKRDSRNFFKRLEEFGRSANILPQLRVKMEEIESSIDARQRKIEQRKAELTTLEEEVQKVRLRRANAERDLERLRGWQTLLEGLRSCLKVKIPMISRVRSAVFKVKGEHTSELVVSRAQACADLITKWNAGKVENCGPKFRTDLVGEGDGVGLDDMGRDVGKKRVAELETRLIEASRMWTKPNSLKSAFEALSNELVDKKAALERNERLLGILRGRGMIFEDVAPPFQDPAEWVPRMLAWKKDHEYDFDKAYVMLAIPELLSPFILSDFVEFVAVPPDSPAVNEKTIEKYFSSLCEVKRINNALFTACLERDFFPEILRIAKHIWDPVSQADSNLLLNLALFVKDNVAADSKTCIDFSEEIQAVLSRQLDADGLPLVQDPADENSFLDICVDRLAAISMAKIQQAMNWGEMFLNYEWTPKLQRSLEDAKKRLKKFLDRYKHRTSQVLDEVRILLLQMEKNSP